MGRRTSYINKFDLIPITQNADNTRNGKGGSLLERCFGSEVCKIRGSFPNCELRRKASMMTNLPCFPKTNQTDTQKLPFLYPFLHVTPQPQNMPLEIETVRYRVPSHSRRSRGAQCTDGLSFVTDSWRLTHTHAQSLRVICSTIQ